MPRRKAAIKREVLPDPLYNSEMLAKFINVIMRRGKKAVAERITYKALDAVVQRLKKDKQHDKPAAGASANKKGPRKADSVVVAHSDALDILEKALHNIRPTVEVKSRRVGGATYQVPVEVDVERGIALAMRWLAKSAQDRAEKTMILRLAAEVIDAYEGRGTAVKIRDDMHRMAKANQAFAHYRW